jgi:hypothetical protein
MTCIAVHGIVDGLMAAMTGCLPSVNGNQRSRYFFHIDNSALR